MRLQQDVEPDVAGVIWLNGASDAILYYRTDWTGSKLNLTPAGQIQGLSGSGVRLLATGDFDSDGRDDLLLERISDSMTLLCFMDGLTVRAPCSRLGIDIFDIDDPQYVFPHAVVGPR